MFKSYELIFMATASFLLLVSVWLMQTEQSMNALWERAFQNQVATPGLVVVGENGVNSVSQAVRNSASTEAGVKDLIINDIEIGDGAKVVADSTVTMHYIGTMPNGREFANSRRQGEPVTFTLGADEVIAGLEQGVLGMYEDGRRIIVVPPSLGYGKSGTDAVAGDATLIFAVELLSVE